MAESLKKEFYLFHAFSLLLKESMFLTAVRKSQFLIGEHENMFEREKALGQNLLVS